MTIKLAHINLAKGFRGGERQTAILIEELSKRGYEQAIFVRESHNEEISLKNYLKKRNIPNLQIFELQNPYFQKMNLFRGFDLVHTHETKGNQLATFVKMFLKVPYIITRRVQFTPKTNFFNKYMYRNSSVNVVLSKAIGEDLSKLLPNMKTEIIPSSFLETIPAEVENIKSRYQGKTIIGHIGAVVDSHKGQCTILESAKLLKDRSDLFFLIVGDGEDLQKCQEESKDLDNIDFIGFKANIFDYLKSFDLFVFPSNHEGLGSTLIDAMRFKKPIVASNVGGIPDIIEDNRNGFLIEAGNNIQLKDKIVEILENNEVSQKFRENNEKDSTMFSPQEMTDKYEEIYKKILKG
jgi:glycosyltransferase involved in cell wall biosynthesis